MNPFESSMEHCRCINTGEKQSNKTESYLRGFSKSVQDVEVDRGSFRGVRDVSVE